MSVNLRGKSLIITGGGTGIGAATAVAAAAAGMRVTICGRRPEPLEATARMIRDAGGEVLVVPLNVTDAGAESDLLDQATAAQGPTWAVFANAGRGLNRTAHETTEDELRALFEVNYFATHRLLAEAARRMLADGRGGHLLACASCLSRFAVPDHAAYAATKASQDMLCQAMRIELKPYGIHVSSVHPITTMTEFFETAASTSGTKPSRVLHDTPRAFRQSPQRVAKAVVRCLRHPRPEVWTSRIVRMATITRGVFPKLFDAKFRRMN